MQGESIKIDDLIIDPKHIIAIDLNAQIYSFKDSVHYPGVRIIMAAIDGEFGTMTDGAGSSEPYTVEYVNEQAEVLRPWLEKMFPCDGRSIRLPELVEVEETGSDAEKVRRCFQCEEVITVPFNDNFCAEVCAKVFVDEIPF